MKEQLESKNIAVEAYRTRVAQLEQIVNQYTDEIVVQKQRLTEIKEEYHEIVEVNKLFIIMYCCIVLYVKQFEGCGKQVQNSGGCK